MLSYAETRRRCLKPNTAEKPLYARYVTYAFSTRLVWLLGPFGFVTPDRVTLVSLAVGLWAAWLALEPTAGRLLGAALALELYYILDCVDGQLSRLRQAQTKTGAFLDTLATYLVQLSFFAALGWGLYSQGADAVYVLAGLVAGLSTVWLSLIWHFRASIFLYHFLRSQRVAVKKSPAAPSRPSAGASLFSWVKKTLTFPLSMNLFTALSVAGFLAEGAGDIFLSLRLAELYVLYTAWAGALVACSVTARWVMTKRIDRDYAELFSVE